jgi:hypothetical protein
MSQATIFSQLQFDSLTFNNLADGINPHFQCPICNFSWQPKLTVGTNVQATFDYNQKVDFTIPTHNNHYGLPCSASNQTIELYIGVHKGPNGTALCIQRSDAEGANGIAANWWNRYSTV